MTKFTVLLVLISLRIFYSPSPVNAGIAPFANKMILSAEPPSPGFVDVNCTVQGERVYLEWVVKENENADLFEVEKSRDGREFVTAALVFGTDEPTTEKYKFYELSGKQKMYYRIKLVNKDRVTTYSTVVTMNPRTVKPVE
jgi:hypothetical protein